MNKQNLLSRAEMKKVMGGYAMPEEEIGDADPSVKACEGKQSGDSCVVSGKNGTCVQGGWIYLLCNVPG